MKSYTKNTNTLNGRKDLLNFHMELLVARLPLLGLLWGDHEFGTNVAVKVLLAEGLELHGGLLESEALLVGVLGDLAGHVVADDGVEAGDKHERLVEQGADAALVGLEALDEVGAEAGHAVGEQAGGVQEVGDHDGLEDVELEVALGAGKGDGGVVAEDLGAEHGQGLALRGVDLAGHDGAAGLVLGELELGETAAGTGAEETDVLCDLEEGDGEGVELAVGLDDGVVGGKSLELVGSSDELGAGHLGDLLSDALSEALEGVEASADGGTTLGEHAQAGKSRLDTLNAVLELGDVARELLTKSQRSGILQVSAADLDDLLELLLLGLESVLEGNEGRKERLLKVEDGGDVHDGGEGVVGGGAHVDVVVGVDGLLAAHGAAEDLDGAVGDDLVGVHVGLGAGAGLPDDEREVVDELERGNLLGGLDDGLAQLGVCNDSNRISGLSSFCLESRSRVQPTKSVLHIDSRSGALEDTKGLDERRRHAVLGLVDPEVAQRALGLASPVLAGVDLELAKGIALGPGVGGHLAGAGEGADVLERGGRLAGGDEGGRAREGSVLCTSSYLAASASDCGERFGDRAGKHGGRVCEASTASLLMRVDCEMEYARIDALSLTFSMPGVLALRPAQTAMLGQSRESTPAFTAP